MEDDKKIRNAVALYLYKNGYEILDSDYDGFIVFKYADQIRFAKIAWRFKFNYVCGYCFDMYTRSEFEEVMFKWKAEHEKLGNIYHDMFNVVIFAEDKTMIIHIKDAQFAYERK